MLIGEKVLLRQVMRADGEYYLKWLNDPEVTQYTGRYLPLTEMEQERFVNSQPERMNNAINLVIEAIDTNPHRPIGGIGFHNMDTTYRNASLGVTVGDKAYWSRGYGTEAVRLFLRYGFEQMNLFRINSYVFAFNERSQRMHRSLGFVEEGRMRKNVYINGEYHDVLIFGLLRDEWQG